MHIFKKKEPVNDDAEEKKVKELEDELAKLDAEESKKKKHDELVTKEKSLFAKVERKKFWGSHQGLLKAKTSAVGFGKTLGREAKSFGNFVVKEEIPAIHRGMVETSEFVQKQGIPAVKKIYGVGSNSSGGAELFPKSHGKTSRRMKRDDTPTDHQIWKELHDDDVKMRKDDAQMRKEMRDW